MTHRDRYIHTCLAISLSTIFFLNSSKIFFRYSSLGMLASNLPLTKGGAKNERFKVKKCSFSRKFSADNLLTLLNLTIHAGPTAILTTCLRCEPPKRRNTRGICRWNRSKRLEYHDIPDCSAKTVVKHLLYSAEYSGLRSCQTPPIFQKNMRNIVER